MVRFNSAIRELCKESKLSTPADPPTTLPCRGFDDSLPSLQDPFSDFESIEDWLIDPDSVMMQPNEIKAESPEGSVAKVAEFRLSGEANREMSFESSCPGGSHLKGARVGISEETHRGNDGKDVFSLDGSALKAEEPGPSREMGFENVTDSAKVEFGVLDGSIEEEMEKVSLIGDRNGISVNSNVPSDEEDGSAKVEECKETVTWTENCSGTNGGNMPDNMVKVESTTGKSEANGDEISDSGDSESDDSSDSSSSSSKEEEVDNDDDLEKEMKDDIEIEEGEIRDLDREDLVLSSGDEEEAGVKGPIKSKHEIEVLPPVPPVNAVLEPHHRTLPVGYILSIMGTKVIVEGAEKHNPLNEGSILWVTETRLPLGLIDEIFGPVKNPYYVVRYNSEKDVPVGICGGTAVSFVTQFANHILNDKDLYKKGYDASGEYDEEVSDEFEFSDDEKEAEYKRSQRMARRAKDDRKQGNEEFVGQKKVQVKGKFRKNRQHPTPPSQDCVGPPEPTVAVPNFIPNPAQGPSVGVPHGCGSCGCSHRPAQAGAGGPRISHMMQPMGYFGGPTPHLFPQSNPIQFNGMPLQQQHMCLPSDFSVNGMQDHQHHNQHQLQMFTGFPNGIPCQTQFNPNQMPLETAAPPFGNLPVGPMPTSLTGTAGFGCFNQMPFGMSIQNQGHNMYSCGGMGEQGDLSGRWFPPSIVQGVFSAPQQFSHGMPSNRGRRPPRGGRSNFSGGRGLQ